MTEADTRSTYPDPPFFYKLFDKSNKDTTIFKELNEPPKIPPSRVVFNRLETDNIVDDSNENPNLTLESPKDNILSQLLDLNHSVLDTYIDFLEMLRKPESYIYQFERNTSDDAENGNSSESKVDAMETENTENTDNADNTAGAGRSNMTGKSVSKSELEEIDPALLRNHLIFLGMGPNMLAPKTNLQPAIEMKANQLREKLFAMRQMLNRMRAHQARQTVIETLKAQLRHKEKECKKIENYIDYTNKLLNKNCKEMIEKKLSKHNKKQSEIDAKKQLFNNVNEKESKQRLKQELDQIFFDPR